MFGKVMSISDELMWRYYELLTDVTVREIDELKRDVAKGAAHPMKLKQELGMRIVADFHGHEAAEHAAQDWSRMFQKDETPDDLPLVTVKFAEVAAPNAVAVRGWHGPGSPRQTARRCRSGNLRLRRLPQGQTKRREDWTANSRTTSLRPSNSAPSSRCARERKW